MSQEIGDFQDLVDTLSLLGGRQGLVILHGRRSSGIVPSAAIRGTISSVEVRTDDVPPEDEGRRLAEFSVGENDQGVVSIDSAGFEGATRRPSELEIRLQDLVVEVRLYEPF